MAPDRVAPAVTDGCALLDVLLVDFNPQSWSLRNAHIALVVGKDFGLRQIVQQIIALVVVDAQALLLDESVVRHRIDLQTSGQRYRAERAVQRKGDVVGFGHGGDLAGFGDAAGVRDIRLDDVDIAFAENSLEIPARIESLTQSDRGAGQRRQFF